MNDAVPQVPRGSGKHPILMVAVAANDLAASTAFYTQLLRCQSMPMGPELTVLLPSSGPAMVLRSKNPEGFPGVVPFISVPKVEAALREAVAAGAAIEREPWKVPMVGTLARFRDGSGTTWGLLSALSAAGPPHVPMPFGSNPKPAAGTVCSLEMYAADGAAAAEFFAGQFGWGSLPTMEQYMAFDPGAGVGGVFQSHTPALPALAYVYVTDVGEALAKLEASGGRRLGEPMALPGMATFGYFKDPSGTSMGLIGP
jgi:predicted enzyme related to lactoylglutathione lyase